jgi:UDP-glucose 4-epimerase
MSDETLFPGHVIGPTYYFYTSFEEHLTLLLTGGAGYIGSVIARHCIDAGYDIIILDDLSEGNARSLPQGVPFYHADYGDKETLVAIFSKHRVDAVIHLAASSSVPHSVIEPELYYRNNVCKTITLLESMASHGVKKMLFSSSAAVYGEPRYLPVDENHPAIPINPYGKSKLFIEDILRDMAAAADFQFIAFRFFCAAGATQSNGEARPNETHLIPLVADCALGKRERMIVYGDTFPTSDGTGVRDYIHVADIAQAHLLALAKINVLSNTAYNIGTDSGYTTLEVIKLAAKVIGRNIPYIVSTQRPGDPAELVASSGKIRAELGWKPAYDLEQIILSAWQWRKNPRY